MATEKKETKAKAAAPKAEKKPAVAKTAAVVSASTAKAGLHRRRVVVGTVVSDKMQKTIVVKVDRSVRHGLYGKYTTKSRRFKAHDEKNEAKIGDQVSVVESRPLSRDKRWALQKIIRRATQAAEVTV